MTVGSEKTGLQAVLQFWDGAAQDEILRVAGSPPIGRNPSILETKLVPPPVESNLPVAEPQSSRIKEVAEFPIRAERSLLLSEKRIDGRQEPKTTDQLQDRRRQSRFATGPRTERRGEGNPNLTDKGINLDLGRRMGAPVGESSGLVLGRTEGYSGGRRSRLLRREDVQLHDDTWSNPRRAQGAEGPFHGANLQHAKTDSYTIIRRFADELLDVALIQEPWTTGPSRINVLGDIPVAPLLTVMKPRNFLCTNWKGYTKVLSENLDRGMVTINNTDNLKETVKQANEVVIDAIMRTAQRR
ncbi:hypothetical protein JTB14_017655 [Gonioctena quinquepunctata]|nr:hypothetical protein JTB14_017655 [Gonioctena quinquepunctata]